MANSTIATRQKRQVFLSLLNFCLTAILLYVRADSQTLKVQGTVTAASQPVQNALITFSDQLDTNNRYTTLTDTAGIYQVNLPQVSIAPTTTLPNEFELKQNYPNPFTATTAITYSLPSFSQADLIIYDLLGRSVRQLQAGDQPAGSYTVFWDGHNDAGQLVANGIYLCQLRVNGKAKVSKMIFSANSNGLAPLPEMAPSRLKKPSLKENAYQSAAVYKVQIENTTNTWPLIETYQSAELRFERDTMINFNVTALPVAMVYTDSLKQYIRGFGGANILQWRPDMTASQVDLAFGVGPGKIGFSILRLRVPYDLSNYNMSIQLPTAKLVQSYGGIVFASPWTPPPALKTNNNIFGGELKESSYAAYASHLKTFAEYMAANGAPLYAISIQNEPDITVNYESCDWSPAQMTKFIAEYGHTIGPKIIAPESYQFLRPISDAILNDSAACAHLDIVGGHIYGGGIASYPLAEAKGKEIWMTEHLDTDTSWNAVLATGKEINDCMNVGMNAYIWWYIVRFYGPILENGTVSKRGYVMSHFARFVRPGFYRIKCTAIPQRNVYLTAYKNEVGKVVLIAINQNTKAVKQTFLITNHAASKVTPYTTTKSKNCVQSDDLDLINGILTATLEAASITTFVID